ncbi:MAG: lipid-A-disaccharide synthase [Gemmatimonadota bacterium]|jgi:lipid-A-disaccharide synthase
MSRSAPSIFLSAGDPSGDAHGAAVAAALLRRWPDARLFGLGGPRMARAGVELLADFDRLTVLGFVEVVRHLPFFLRLLRRMRAELARRHTDLVLPIDYPGFNLRLARSAHTDGLPVLYYIAPQVWAWHRSRAAELARVTDLLAVVLPFEVPLFRDYGADARFVGHPLLDLPPETTERADFCRGLGLDPDRPILAIFPGSRRQEVDRHLDLFLEAARRLTERRPDIQPVVARAADVPASRYAGSLVPVADGPRALLAHAHAALVKSGTTTLETALAGVPMVIAYRTHPLTFWIARRLVDVEHIGLVNLVAGERLAPELLQGAATSDALAGALLPLVDAGPPRDRALNGLRRVRTALEPEDDGRSTAERVVDLAASILEAR